MRRAGRQRRPSGARGGGAPCYPLRCEVIRSMVIERTVRPHPVVVMPPQLEFLTDVGQRKEYFHIQTFIPQPTVEGLDIAIFHRPARTDEVQVDAILISPRLHRPADEFAAIVHRDRDRRPALGDPGTAPAPPSARSASYPPGAAGIHRQHSKPAPVK